MSATTKRSQAKVREEARRLYLTGEMSTNAEIAARLAVKPHTIGKWRREEDWDGLRSKIDIRAAEMFIEKIATDRVTLNVGHFRLWQALLGKLGEIVKTRPMTDVRDLERLAGILDRAQKGQRLAKGLSLSGESEEAIRAQSEAEIRKVVDTFIDSIKENVHDEEARERIRVAILASLPDETSDGAGQSGDSFGH
jgi:hypothetical protein